MSAIHQALVVVTHHLSQTSKALLQSVQTEHHTNSLAIIVEFGVIAELNSSIHLLFQIYVAVPATVNATRLEITGFQKEISFFPHVSIEAPPWKPMIAMASNYLQTIGKDPRTALAEGKRLITELRSLLSLDLYRYKIVA